MTVVVAASEGRPGKEALSAGAAEARLLGTDLLVINMTLTPLDLAGLPSGSTVVERDGPDDSDPADVVLDEILDLEQVQRLVIGIRRRSRLSKALLGSISQRLLLESPVPVLAVKAP